MSDLETKLPGPATEPEKLSEQVAALQSQIFTLLLALFIVSGTLTVFLWRQARYAGKDLESVKGPAAQLIQAFNQEKPRGDKFIALLVDYGKTHPDFVPILKKYQIPLANAPAAPTPAAATPVPAPKK